MDEYISVLQTLLVYRKLFDQKFLLQVSQVFFAMEGESWSAAFDPAMLEEDSEVMAQLFGCQEMFWSDQMNAGSYFFTEYYDEPSMNMAASAINGEQVAIPSFPVSIRMNEEMISSSKIADSTAKSRVPPKRKIEEDEDDGDDIPVEVPTRRPRASAPVTKRGKKAQNKKKAQKSASEEAINADVNPQSSSCYSSEDDSNGSLELKGAGSMSSSSKGEGKKRADRGTATDPQSLYARKRRERINERLKILQKLVPNGTKVDISTMLEEAVQYVKFLQLQIKLLSSDDLWMYAPIAYNGMNLGFDLKISGL